MVNKSAILTTKRLDMTLLLESYHGLCACVHESCVEKYYTYKPTWKKKVELKE